MNRISANQRAKQIAEEMEDAVDQLGLVEVLTILMTMCFDKAEHIEANYGRDAQSRAWHKAAKVISKAANTIYDKIGDMF